MPTKPNASYINNLEGLAPGKIYLRRKYPLNYKSLGRGWDKKGQNRAGIQMLMRWGSLVSLAPPSHLCP